MLVEYQRLLQESNLMEDLEKSDTTLQDSSIDDLVVDTLHFRIHQGNPAW